MKSERVEPAAIVLLTVGDTVSTARQGWEAFLIRRSELTSRMELATCDGCDGCGARCIDGFTVTEEEYMAVQAYLATRPADEVERIDRQEKTQPWPGAEDLGVTIDSCRYRDMENGNCSIYPVRPTVCRLFGHTDWLPCPIEAISGYPNGGAAVWNDYQRFEKRTWSAWDALKSEQKIG